MPKFMNLHNVLMDEAGDDGAAGGGGSDEPSIEDLQATIADLSSQVEKVNAKNQELLGEKKKAQQLAKEEADAKEAAKIEAAKKTNDFEQLHKSAMGELEATKSQLSELQGKVAGEKINNAAMKIAGQLADGSNAELLADFIGKRLKFSEGELKVTNPDGELTISTLSDLEKEFANDTRYSALLKGNQSSGGGATGGTKSSGAAKTITRAEFNALNPAERKKFFSDGGTTTD